MLKELSGKLSHLNITFPCPERGEGIGVIIDK